MFRLWMHFLSLLLAGGMVGLLVGCQPADEADVDRTSEGTIQLGAVEATDTLSRTVAPSGRPLVLDGFRGAVALRGHDAATAELSFVRRGRGEDPDAARAARDDIEVSESGSQEAYAYTLASGRPSGAYAAVDVQGAVPRATTLRVEQTSGPVTIDEVAGPLTVRQDHGAVAIRDAAAAVDVSVRNGDLAAHFRTVPPDATVTLETANGDVTVWLPPEASARLDAQTNAGAIRTNGLSLTDERFNPIDAGGRYRATLGGGDASIEVRTNNGTVRFGVADTAATRPLLPPDTLAVPPSDTTVTSPSAPDTVRGDTTRLDTTTTPPAPAADTLSS
jgi:hypothetical protein